MEDNDDSWCRVQSVSVVDRVMGQMVSRRPLTAEFLGSILDHSIRDLLWTNLYQGRFLYQYFGVPLSVSLHQCPSFFYGSTARVCLGRLIVLVSRLHPVRHNTHGRTPSGPVISSSHRPDNTQHSKETDIHDLDGIRTRNPSKGAAVDPKSDRAVTRIISASYII